MCIHSELQHAMRWIPPTELFESLQMISRHLRLSALLLFILVIGRFAIAEDNSNDKPFVRPWVMSKGELRMPEYTGALPEYLDHKRSFQAGPYCGPNALFFSCICSDATLITRKSRVPSTSLSVACRCPILRMLRISKACVRFCEKTYRRMT